MPVGAAEAVPLSLARQSGCLRVTFKTQSVLTPREPRGYHSGVVEFKGSEGSDG